MGATSLALAHFVAKDFEKGITILQHAMESSPGNQQIVYNLAISRHGRASKILKNTEERQKPDKVQEVVELLKQAKEGFAAIVDAFLQCREKGKDVPLGFEDLQKLEMKKLLAICRGRLSHCDESIEQCNRWLEQQVDSVMRVANKQLQDREKQLRLMKEEEDRYEEMKKQQMEEERQKQKEAEELAESLMEVALGMQLPRETDKELPKEKN